MESKSKDGCCRVLGIVAGVGVFALLTAVVSVLLVRTYQPTSICGDTAVLTGHSNFFPKEESSDAIENLEIADKGVIVTRTLSSGMCFIMHKSAEPVGDNARPMRRVGGSLTVGQIEFVGGKDAVAFCDGLLTYLAKEIETEIATARNKRSTLDIPIDQREPNCLDLLLLCPDQLNTTSTCFTWINGVMYMERKCLAENQFQIKMTKPPGRILKIAQQQWRECLFRRQEGKRC